MSPIRPVLFAVALAALAVPLAAAATAAPAAPAGSAGVANATGDASLVVRDVPNTTNHLDIDQDAVERGDHGETSLNVGAAVEMDAVRLGSEYRQERFAQRYDGATTDDARNEGLREEITRLAVRLTQIENHQQDVIARYNDDDVTTATFLRELATVQVAASEVAQGFDRIRDTAGFALSESHEQRIESLETRLVALRGPVRDRVGASLVGDRGPTTAYALTSSNAVVLSNTDGTRTYREAHLPDNRASLDPDMFPTDSDPSGIVGASDHARELYPWAYSDAGPSINKDSDSVYVVTLEHGHGTLETYLDGATQSPFREFQTLRIDRLPKHNTTNETSALTLRVNRTYGTGPMEVSVVDTLTGDPVDATVTVNGFDAGSTGADGSLWTISPHRSVRIEAHADNETVRVNYFAN